MNQLAQMLLEFAEVLEQKPINLEDLRPVQAEPEVRRVKRRTGRRALANFENLPVNTYVYELSAEERLCPGCGVERQEIGSEKSRLCESQRYRGHSCVLANAVYRRHRDIQLECHPLRPHQS